MTHSWELVVGAYRNGDGNGTFFGGAPNER